MYLKVVSCWHGFRSSINSQEAKLPKCPWESLYALSSCFDPLLTPETVIHIETIPATPAPVLHNPWHVTSNPGPVLGTVCLGLWPDPWPTTDSGLWPNLHWIALLLALTLGSAHKCFPCHAHIYSFCWAWPHLGQKPQDFRLLGP